GNSSEKHQLLAARWSAFGIGIIATLFALKLENINVTFLVSLTFLVASASIFPVLFLTIYWKKFNQMVVLTGMVSGLGISLLLVLLEPNIMNKNGSWINNAPPFPLYNPGVIAISVGFLGAIPGNLLYKKDQKSVSLYEQFQRRAQ